MALSLATENDALITLLHVMEAIPEDTGAGLYLAVPEIGPLRHELIAQARTKLRKSVPDAARNFCEVRERVESGAPWREILRVAEEIDADLIVMGAHTPGRRGPAALRLDRQPGRASGPLPRAGGPGVAEALGRGGRGRSGGGRRRPAEVKP